MFINLKLNKNKNLYLILAKTHKKVKIFLFLQIKIKELLGWYSELKKVTFEDIVEFHYKFEVIHPFQDGNGRVGRLIAFKECLKNDIVPFYIDDANKWLYYRGLQEWHNDKNFLIETCKFGQDQYKMLLDYFNIKY